MVFPRYINYRTEFSHWLTQVDGFVSGEVAGVGKGLVALGALYPGELLDVAGPLAGPPGGTASPLFGGQSATKWRVRYISRLSRQEVP
jgi:hypothetical protein